MLKVHMSTAQGEFVFVRPSLGLYGEWGVYYSQEEREYVVSHLPTYLRADTYPTCTQARQVAKRLASSVSPAPQGSIHDKDFFRGPLQGWVLNEVAPIINKRR